MLSLGCGWGETGSETGNCQSSESTLKNEQSPSHPVPLNDARRSFSTKERLVIWTKNGHEVAISQQKDAFLATSGRFSENALFGGLFGPGTSSLYKSTHSRNKLEITSTR